MRAGRLAPHAGVWAAKLWEIFSRCPEHADCSMRQRNSTGIHEYCKNFGNTQNKGIANGSGPHDPKHAWNLRGVHYKRRRRLRRQLLLSSFQAILAECNTSAPNLGVHGSGIRSSSGIWVAFLHVEGCRRAVCESKPKRQVRHCRATTPHQASAGARIFCCSLLRLLSTPCKPCAGVEDFQLSTRGRLLVLAPWL